MRLHSRKLAARGWWMLLNLAIPQVELMIEVAGGHLHSRRQLGGGVVKTF